MNSYRVLCAEVELEQWDEPNFEIIDVSLSIMFPEQRDYLFEGLSPQQGPAAVNSIRQLLRRVEILESGSDPNREATRAEDKAAIKELETTQILTKATRKHLAALIEIVETPSEDDVKHVERYNKQQAYHEDALKRLGLWIKKWRTIAKRTITRRSDLISLGLAERRKKNDADTLPSETPNTENVESEVVVDPPTTP